MKVDMSPEAITGRMKMLGQLWELSVALKTSKIVDDSDGGTTLQARNASNAEDSIDNISTADAEHDF